MKLNPNATAGKRGTHRAAKPPGRSLCAAAVIAISLWLAGAGAHAQVNSGSNGSDGAFHPTTNIVINMADHPDGIYHYTSVNIPSGVTVKFVPNANNTPVVWLVQSNCIIAGGVDVSGKAGENGQNGNGIVGGIGGPGGFSGGNGGVQASSGVGPGGGIAGLSGAGASFGGLGETNAYGSPPGATYGNSFLIPLIGGSGGGGASYYSGAGGGGGGGAILIAADTIQLLPSGYIGSAGGYGGAIPSSSSGAGGGSGGAVRLIASQIGGSGSIVTYGGGGGNFNGGSAGRGRVRFDTFQNNFGGDLSTTVFTHGYQPIIIPTNGQGTQLTVTSVGGVPVSVSPSGQLATPDTLLSAQQSNPMSIVVHCSNVPLNTQITVSVKPANATTVSATGLNSSGTLSSSTATILINMPRGGGIIYATAATGN